MSCVCQLSNKEYMMVMMINKHPMGCDAQMA